MGRKKILEPLYLQNRVANACFTFGKERAYSIFCETVSGLYSRLKGIEEHHLSEDVSHVIQIYLSEVKRCAPYTEILGEAIAELSPYIPNDVSRPPYLPKPVTSLMASSKYMDLDNIRFVSDPSCGSGTYVMSLMRELIAKKSIKDIQGWKIHASDRHRINAEMCAVQLMMNTAIFDIAPGNLKVEFRPVDIKGEEIEILRMNYYESTKQYEIYKAGLSAAGSAQALLFGV